MLGTVVTGNLYLDIIQSVTRDIKKFVCTRKEMRLAYSPCCPAGEGQKSKPTHAIKYLRYNSLVHQYLQQ